jgi:hypothetical protein
MATVRLPLWFIIQRVGVGDGVGLGAEAGVKMTVSIADRRNF